MLLPAFARFWKLVLLFLSACSFRPHLGVTICLTHNNILKCELRQWNFGSKTLIFLLCILLGYCDCLWYINDNLDAALGWNVCRYVTPSSVDPGFFWLPFALRGDVSRRSPSQCTMNRAAPTLSVYNLTSGIPDWFAMGSHTEQNSSIGPDVRACFLFLFYK